MLIQDLYHRSPRTIAPTVKIGLVVKKLLDQEHNGFIVVDKEKHVLGVLSLQDIAAAAIPDEFRNNIGMAKAMYTRGFFHEMCKELKERTAADLMRKNFVSVKLTDNIMAVIADFLENDLYVVPVIKDKKLVGVVTRTEVKKALGEGMGLTA